MSDPRLTDEDLIRDVVKRRDRADFSRDENKRLTRVLADLKDGARLLPASGVVGAREVAALTGKEKSTITRWRRDGYLPEPVSVLAQGPVWIRDEIVAFAKRHDALADAAGRRPLPTDRAPVATA